MHYSKFYCAVLQCRGHLCKYNLRNQNWINNRAFQACSPTIVFQFLIFTSSDRTLIFHELEPPLCSRDITRIDTRVLIHQLGTNISRNVERFAGDDDAWIACDRATKGAGPPHPRSSRSQDNCSGWARKGMFYNEPKQQSRALTLSFQRANGLRTRVRDSALWGGVGCFLCP